MTVEPHKLSLSLDRRGQLLRAAVGFAGCSMPSYDRALHALRSWLDSWSGIGHVAVGMARQGYDLQLTRYDEKGWRATFYTTGMEHSPTSATGTAWERTPWHATQRAAWEALRQLARMNSGDAPLVIPHLETSDVQLKGLPAQIQRDPLHQQLVHRDDCVAGVARFAGTGTTRNPSDAVMRQAPVLELASDDKTERFLVHRASCAGGHPSRARTPTPQSSGRGCGTCPVRGCCRRGRTRSRTPDDPS